MGRPKGTIRLVAEALGLDHGTVRHAVTAAGLDVKTVTFEEAKRLTESIADPDRVIGHAAIGRGEGGYTGDAYAEAKAAEARQRTRKMELQNARLEGSLIDRKSVEVTGAKLLGDLRVALLALGVRVAPRVAGLADVKAVARLIEEEMRSTLTTFVGEEEERFVAAIEAEALS
jgi:hypothetical protein